jgi:hypothetical protein
MSEWSNIDEQLANFGTRLRDDLKISPETSLHLATTIADEIRQLLVKTPDFSKKLQNSYIPVNDRKNELVAFQGFMAFCNSLEPNPYIIRSQVCYQNYICFVYLGDAWFKELRKNMVSDSSTKLCCKFLTDNPVRAFRNAIAHGNWRYLSDYSGIEFWAKKGEGKEEPVVKFEVTQNDLNFWQALARCVAYCIAEVLLEYESGRVKY